MRATMTELNTTTTQLTIGATIADLGKTANEVAAKTTFQRELAGKSHNTRISYAKDLDTWNEYLAFAGADVVDCDWFNDVNCWEGVTHGLVLGFVAWMQKSGFAISTINRKLSTVRKFCAMAAQAGIIDAGDLALIQSVKTIRRNQGIEIDRQREQTRIDRPNAKKAKSVELTPAQAKQLKDQPTYSPQGRRDALLMCLLLDHGLRVGEVTALTVDAFNLRAGTMTFYRDKVKKSQTHKLTADTLRAIQQYIETGDVPAVGPLLRGSRKNGELTHAGMSVVAITARVKALGKQIGVDGLSSHDCRHFWATDANRNGTDPFALLEAGGWTSMQTLQRYVNAATVANEGVKLSH